MREKRGESAFSSAISGLIDLIIAGLLWLICSLPIVTIGPASVALYYSISKSVRHERGRLMPTFFSAFRAEFKQAMLVWLIYLGYILLGLADMYAVKLMGIPEGSVLYYLSRLFFAPALLTLPWVFAFISRFQNSIGGTFKFIGYLTLKNIARSILLAAELMGFGLIVWLIPQLLPLLPGICCLLMSLVIEPVFKAVAQNAQDDNTDQWYNE